ncbi:MAG: TadE/TadG family type IV pilus assembly protein [Acidimicrobiales bacterium]
MRTPERSFSEQGSAAVEAVVLTSLLMIFVLLAVAFGRYEATRAQVAGAARAAADAAAVVSSADMASSAASSVATPELEGSGASCTRTTVSTDTREFVPGGYVSVTVTCTVGFSDLGVPGLPEETTVAVTQVAPIDPYRAVS